MAGYVINIEKATMQNDNFRKVLNTAQHSQLVVMSLLPGEEIGTEVHDLDQFIRFESGRGKVILDGKEYEVEDDWAVVIPAGVEHNVINTSDSQKMKLYSIYSPPEHPEGTVHPTKADDTGHDH
ncbi:MAG: cupin domain-containing protein [Deltaproteobacteria bacterium]|nr:MAG: cupin domain-containing protein [Deltaproteobacteria bacterium]